MSKLYVGILISSVLIGILTVIPENVNAETWNIETVDSVGIVGGFTSIELDKYGYSHISYYDNTKNNLKYAKWTGSTWSINTVDSAGDVGGYTSMALDNNGYPHISYIDYTNYNLKYAKWTGSTWSINTVDSAGNVGAFTSIALDNNDYPHISYIDYTNYNLKYAKWTGSTWSINTVDSAGNVDAFTSIALDNNDYPHISYHDRTKLDLKYAKRIGSTWSIETVDSAGYVGPFISMTLDNNGYPHISYWDETNTNLDLKYAKWTGSKWNIETVDFEGDVGGFNPIALDSNYYPRISYHDTTNQDLKYVKMTGSKWNFETVDSAGSFTSIALDSHDDPHICYYDTTTRDLNYAKWTGSKWNIETVDSAGDVGKSTSIALDINGYPHISYYDNTKKDLKYAKLIPEVPTRPRNLKVTAGDSYVYLKWDAPSDDGGLPITGYRIYSGLELGKEEFVKKVVDGYIFSDKNLKNDRTYYYYVCAINSVGEGEKSELVEGTPIPDITLPSAPQNLKSSLGDRKVTLKWDAPSDDGGTHITGYKVYRGNTSQGEKTLLRTVGNVETYTDKNVTNNQTYYYNVGAVNSKGEGRIKSNEVSATPNKEYDWQFIGALIGALALIILVLSKISAIIKIINNLISRKRRYFSVFATSRPDGAKVFLDGVDKGKSPVTLDKIQKGTHIVLFSKSGYSDCERRVVVNADQTTTVHCDLKKPEMKLRLSPEPTEIPADGKSKSMITISVEDENGTPAPVPQEMTIVLETNIGLIDSPVVMPAGDAQATSILTSSTAGGTATVKAKSGTGLKNDVAVRYIIEGTEITRIFGTIRNSVNRDPVQEVSIKLNIEGTQIAAITSNKQGEYEYIAEQDYTGQTLYFTIKKDNYIQKNIVYEIDRPTIKSVILLDETKIKIKGKICDETDSPLDDASISFSIGNSTINLNSDKDGSFSFTIGQQLLNQTIGYEVSRKGFKIKSGKLTLIEDLKCINLIKRIPNLMDLIRKFG